MQQRLRASPVYPALRSVRRAQIRVLKRLDERRRARTASHRALPDYVILGAQKAGTTSLHRYLRAHSQVVTVRWPIEPQYFSHRLERGEQWYRQNFPLRAELSAARERIGRPVITGEKSSHYLYHPLAAERARELLPDAKLIALLRNPVDRAVSHYAMNIRRGYEPLELREALAAEPERVEEELRRIASSQISPHGGPAFVFGYSAMGRYAEQLERWYRHFPPENLLVIKSEDLFSDPAATYERCVTFLGLSTDDQLATFRQFNTGGYREHLDDGIAEAVLEATAEDRARLAELTGISWD